MNSFFRKLRSLAHRSEKEAALREELQFHLEEEAEQRQADGLAENEVPQAARRDLGNLALVEEDTRAAGAGRDWSNSHAMPVTDCARSAGTRGSQPPQSQHWRSVGITAMFSAFDTILIRPLPYDDLDRLVMIWLDMRNENRSSFLCRRQRNGWSGGATTTAFTDIAARQPGAATLSGDSEPEHVPARKTTANIWGVLGAEAPIGRVFTEEGLRGLGVAVISHWLWLRRGSPDILGRKTR